MRQATCLLLSLLMLSQPLFAYVPEELRSIYGETDPCEHYTLKYNMDEIRKLEDREFNIYKIQNEKCENYKKAIIELKTLQNSQIQQANTWEFIQYVIYAWLIWSLFQPIFDALEE